MQRLIVTSFLIAAGTVMSNHAVLAARTSAAPPQSLRALVAETQRTSEDLERVEIVWWIPVDFWRLTMASDPSVSREQLDQVNRVLSPYILIGVADGDIGPFGGLTWTSEDTLRSRLVIVDSKGEEYKPLPAKQIGEDARNLIEIFKPMLAKIIGAVGENLHFFYFPARTSTGTPVADPGSEGEFSVRSADRVHRWRLPLGSLFPQKACPVDGERMNGAWKFCPWHGKELVTPR